MPTTVMVRCRIWLWVARPTRVTRSPTVTSMASARPLPMSTASQSSAIRLRPSATCWPTRLAGSSASGSTPTMPTPKAPLRPLTMPPVLMRRVAASIRGERVAAATIAAASSSSSGSIGCTSGCSS